MKITCPQCQAPYQVPDNASGKKTSCAKCGLKFRIEPTQPVVQTPEPPPEPQSFRVEDAPETPPIPLNDPAYLPVPNRARRTRLEAFEDLDNEPHKVKVEKTVDSTYQMKGAFRTAFGLSSGCLLGALAVMVGLPLLACGGFLLVGAVGKVQEAAERAKDINNAKAIAAASTDEGESATAPKAAPRATASGETVPRRFIAPDELCEIDGATVHVFGAEVSKIRIRNNDGSSDEVGDDCLQIDIRISVKNPAKKYAYSSWRRSGYRESKARLIDTLGNVYKSRYTTIDDIAGSTNYKTMYDGDSVRDVLVFDKPVPAADTLMLDLDGSNIDVTDKFRFLIKKSLWAKPAAK